MTKKNLRRCIETQYARAERVRPCQRPPVPSRIDSTRAEVWGRLGAVRPAGSGASRRTRKGPMPVPCESAPRPSPQRIFFGEVRADARLSCLTPLSPPQSSRGGFNSTARSNRTARNGTARRRRVRPS